MRYFIPLALMAALTVLMPNVYTTQAKNVKNSDRNINVPSFTMKTAQKLLDSVDEGWNSHDPQKVVRVYSDNVTMDTMGTIVKGKDNLVKMATQLFIDRKNYHVKTTVFICAANKISTRFDAEWNDDNGVFYHSRGMQNVTCDKNGKITHRYTVFNAKAINESEKIFK